MKTLRQCATGDISPFFPLLLLLILFFNHANAQLTLINEFTPPSAQASQFTKYGKYNPQLYTGALSLSIPIYTYKDKDFEIPVSLDYSYNGLVANKQATEVGMGWSLDCGGCITREVRGIPDEEIGTIVWTESGVQETLYGFDFVPFDNADSLGTLYTTPFSKLTSSVDVLKTFYTYNKTNYESSTDRYHFSFLGKTGSFIRNMDGSFTVFNSSSYNGEFKVVKENADDYQGKGVASQFIITAGDGYKYYFGDINSTDAIYTERAGSSGKGETDHMTILAWKFMKIVAPSGRTVDYIYGDGPFEIQNYTSPSWYNLPSSSPSLSTSLSTVTCSCLTEINIDGGGSLRFMYSSKPSGKTGKYISGRGLLDITGTSPLLTNIICSNTEAELGYTYNLTGVPILF